MRCASDIRKFNVASMTSDGAYQHAFRYPNIVDSTFHHLPGVGWSPSLSREGNVSHAFICEAFLHYYLVYKKAFRLPLVIRMVSQSLSLAHQLCFPLFKRSGINYPPSDKQMVPLSLQKGVTCCLLSFAPRSVYPERMYVGALTSSWQVGAIPQELQGYGFCE